MVRQVRLFDRPDSDNRGNNPGRDNGSDTAAGPTMSLGPSLGTLHITFNDDAAAPSSWGGKIRGSDYLVWGMNHRRVIIEFDDGERASAVIRATGDLIGLGERPAALAR